MAKVEERFYVVNRKHLNNPDIVPRKKRVAFMFALQDLSLHLPEHNYMICNMDEPYADKVIKTILDGEDAKE